MVRQVTRLVVVAVTFVRSDDRERQIREAADIFVGDESRKRLNVVDRSGLQALNIRMVAMLC